MVICEARSKTCINLAQRSKNVELSAQIYLSNITWMNMRNIWKNNMLNHNDACGVEGEM